MRANDQRGPATTPNPAHTTTDSVTADADRRPGEWPDAAALREKWQREHSRRTQAFNSIAEHLREQPSTQSVRTAARLWCMSITHLADEIVTARQEHHQ